jgi:hypothetical protein
VDRKERYTGAGKDGVRRRC